MQTDHVIDCATTPIFSRGPTDTARFDACGSARSEQANAATSNLTFGMFTQITKVCTDDWKVATRSCRDRSRFAPPSLTS